MTTKRLLALLATSAVLGCGATPSDQTVTASTLDALRGDPGCGRQVTREGSTFEVKPGGGDDTAALQCVLDAASAVGRHVTIKLAAGTFVTAPLHAIDFRGTIRGAGKGKTVLQNPDSPVYVTPVFQPNEPSAKNIWPAMIVFLRGDFTVSDLTIHVRGAVPTQGWDLFGMVFTKYTFGIGVEANGGEAHASFERVAVIGDDDPDDPMGYGVNLINGISFEGLVGFPTSPPLPTSGSFRVHDCEFRKLISGTPTFNLKHAKVRIEGSTFDTAFDATEAGDSTDLDFAFVNNHVTAAYSAYTPFDMCLGAPAGCGMTDSRILFAENRIHAPMGIDLSNAPFANVRCRVEDNDFTYDLFAVHLGPATNHCLVETAGAVLDEGTGNRVVRP
jgi:hypothetical protein